MNRQVVEAGGKPNPVRGVDGHDRILRRPPEVFQYFFACPLAMEESNRLALPGEPRQSRHGRHPPSLQGPTAQTGGRERV